MLIHPPSPFAFIAKYPTPLTTRLNNLYQPTYPRRRRRLSSVSVRSDHHEPRPTLHVPHPPSTHPNPPNPTAPLPPTIFVRVNNLYQAWRPRLAPLRFELRILDDESGDELTRTEFQVSAKDKMDPSKFACKLSVGLRDGGRVELSCTYTSRKRLKREMFQGCDPVKLLFGLFILWINWFSFNVGSTQVITLGTMTCSRDGRACSTSCAVMCLNVLGRNDASHDAPLWCKNKFLNVPPVVFGVAVTTVI